MCGCLLHSAPTGTAPALQAVRAVSEGEETPKEKRWWRQAWRSSTPLCFPSTRACLCQDRPRSPPPLGGVNVKNADSLHRHFLAISYCTTSTWHVTWCGSRPEPSPDPAEAFSPGRTPCRDLCHKLRRHGPVVAPVSNPQQVLCETVSLAPRYHPTGERQRDWSRDCKR